MKAVETHQLHKMLGVSLKSMWFLMHRIREAMREPFFGTQMGGFRKPVQADETLSDGRPRELVKSFSTTSANTCAAVQP
jgi:hypothetical protein